MCFYLPALNIFLTYFYFFGIICQVMAKSMTQFRSWHKPKSNPINTSGLYTGVLGLTGFLGCRLLTVYDPLFLFRSEKSGFEQLKPKESAMNNSIFTSISLKSPDKNHNFNHNFKTLNTISIYILIIISIYIFYNHLLNI